MFRESDAPTVHTHTHTHTPDYINNARSYTYNNIISSSTLSFQSTQYSARLSAGRVNMNGRYDINIYIILCIIRVIYYILYERHDSREEVPIRRRRRRGSSSHTRNFVATCITVGFFGIPGQHKFICPNGLFHI